MSFRAGLSSGLFRPLTSRSAQSHLPQLTQRTLSTARSTFAQPGRSARLSLSPILFPLALGSSYAAYNILNSPAQCESSSSAIANAFSSGPTPEVGAGNPPPHSDLSAYQLGFGAVCGICTGIFVKKGLKAIAFLLGGVFILMQYMSTKRFITVDWSKLAGTYDKTFGSKGPAGEVRPPTVGGVGAWFVDFVTANFQRLALGLRLG